MNRGHAIALCFFAVSLSAHAQNPLRKAHMQVVSSSSLFQSTNRNDATAALRVWMDLLGQRRGFQIDLTVDVLDDIAEIRRRVQAGTVSLLALDPVEYLKLGETPSLDPVFSTSRTDVGVSPHYVALVRDESGISSLEGLRGRSAIVYAPTAAQIGRIWMNSMLQEAALGKPDHFFQSVEVVNKPSSAILPVFFGKADAAIVDSGTFDVTREMNPQIGRKLRILRSSPPILEGIVCLAKNHQYREELIEALRGLHTEPQGRQILLVFGFSKLVPFDKAGLAQVRTLWHKQNLLLSPEQASSPAAEIGPVQ